jgi:hypothetical protein
VMGARLRGGASWWTWSADAPWRTGEAVRVWLHLALTCVLSRCRCGPHVGSDLALARAAQQGASISAWLQGSTLRLCFSCVQSAQIVVQSILLTAAVFPAVFAAFATFPAAAARLHRSGPTAVAVSQAAHAPGRWSGW